MESEGGGGGAQVTILIVDDEPLNRELLRRVLQRDYRVEEAEDAVGAIAVLEQAAEPIRLVLCDQLMPGRSGTELADEVRRRWPGVCFVLLTGYDDDRAVKEAKASGLVYDVVSKPWRGLALKKLIQEFLNGD
jgi:two-component system, NtrC family, response regulator HupR/HoxA